MRANTLTYIPNSISRLLIAGIISIQKKTITVNETVNPSIFHSNLFLTDGKPVLYKQWFDAGIQKLGNILDMNCRVRGLSMTSSSSGLTVKTNYWNL